MQDTDEQSDRLLYGPGSGSTFDHPRNRSTNNNIAFCSYHSFVDYTNTRKTQKEQKAKNKTKNKTTTTMITTDISVIMDETVG
jgi:hypothetical protein